MSTVHYRHLSLSDRKLIEELLEIPSISLKTIAITIPTRDTNGIMESRNGIAKKIKHNANG